MFVALASKSYAQAAQFLGEKKLYYGASYYPEDWNMQGIDEDIKRMKELHMNVVRMGEFAWSKMEPVEGKYEFTWLKSTINKLHSNGISTILCTPTATPPAWLGEKYPDIYFQDETGIRKGHGARRNTSYTSKHYQEYSIKICEEMAKALGNEPGVIGWQTDNEFNVVSDYGEETRLQWQKWLKKRYGSVDAINSLWNLNLWSQGYNSFEQIPMPSSLIWHHPSLRFAWAKFCSDMVVEYQDLQLVAIRKYSKIPITHDSPGGDALYYNDLFVNLDFAALNNYHSFEAYDLIQSNYDRMRVLKNGYYWLFETAPGFAGGGPTGNSWYLHQIPGSMRAALWMNYAMGGQGAMFWLWRQHWAGQEMVHGSILSAWGKPAANYDEIKQLGQELINTSEFLMENPVPKAEAAIVYSHDSGNGFKIENYANGINYYTDWTYRFYLPMTDDYIFRDVIYPDSDFSAYKLLFLPMLPQLGNNLRTKLEAWVKAGGVLILGPMSGYRSPEWTQYTEAMMGDIESWMGISGESLIPIGAQRYNKEIPFPLSFDKSLNLKQSTAWMWSLAISSKTGKELARYEAGHHLGKSAIIENSLGKGTVIVLGTDPEKEAMRSLIKYAAEKAQIKPLAIGDGGVVVVPRIGKNNNGVIIVNITKDSKKIRLNGSQRFFTDLITGNEQQGMEEFELKPYEIRVLKGKF